MPHLQGLWDRFRCEPDGVILAVNTAFEKSRAPIMADEKNTLQHLRIRGWTMPVARDADEQTVKLFRRSLPGKAEACYGTPMAVVIGPDGKILAHEWPTDDAALARLEQAFTNALQALTFPALRAVSPVLREAVAAIARRKFGEARTKAEAKGLAAPEDAAYLVTQIDAMARRRIERARRLYAFDPDAGIKAALETYTQFVGVPSAGEFAHETNTWREDIVMQLYREQREETGKIEEKLRAAGHRLSPADATPWIGRLEKLARSGAGNRAGEPAATVAYGIRAALAGPGWLGGDVQQAPAGKSGVLLTSVAAVGPAAEAGLRAGDRILRVGDVRPSTPEEFSEALHRTHPGDALEIECEREGAALTVPITLGYRVE